MKIRMVIGIAAVAASATLPLAAKPLVWWTMQNDAANGGSNIVAETTFTNVASAANEFYGKIGYGARPNYGASHFILPVPTNGFESPFMLQDGVCGVPVANDFAIDIPSDPDSTAARSIHTTPKASSTSSHSQSSSSSARRNGQTGTASSSSRIGTHLGRRRTRLPWLRTATAAQRPS